MRATTFKLLRHAAGLRQVVLAEQIGRDQAWVSRFERGLPGARVSPDLAEKIAATLGTSPEKLFEESK